VHKLKLGILADEISRDFREAVRIGKAAGIERFEVRFLPSGRIPRCDAHDLHEVEAVAQGEGITITAISPGLFKHAATEQEYHEQMREVFPAASDLALRWKTKLMVFGFRKPEATEKNFAAIPGAIPAHVIAWMGEVVAQAEQLGVPLLLEPEPISWTDTGLRAAEMIRRVGHAGLRMNYDPGNVAWMTRRDPVDEWPEIADVVAHMHLKDTLLAPADGNFPAWVVMGKGDINYPTLFRQMCAAGFQGDISIESHLKMAPLLLEEYKAAVERLWLE
jgi:sugar phosphate isomerase/epimerase